jgi:hypothetical protein
MHYLKGKLVIEVGKDLKREFLIDSEDNQSISDIQKNVHELFETLPSAYKEICEYKLLVKRHYENINKEVYDPNWIEVKD